MSAEAYTGVLTLSIDMTDQHVCILFTQFGCSFYVFGISWHSGSVAVNASLRIHRVHFVPALYPEKGLFRILQCQLFITLPSGKSSKDIL